MLAGHQRWERLGSAAVAAVVAIALPAVVHAQSGRTTTPAAQTREGIRDHIDQVEDAVDALLDWRHVLTATTQGKTGTPPSEPADTLMIVDRTDLKRVSDLLAATLQMLPARAPATATPRGDVRAHVEKAQEIAREMLPDNRRPVGTTGTDQNRVTVDRTALERLKVEIEAAERLARRAPR